MNSKQTQMDVLSDHPFGSIWDGGKIYIFVGKWQIKNTN